MQQLLARATGQGAGSRVRPAATGSAAPPIAWGEIDAAVDVVAAATVRAQPVVDATQPNRAPRAAADAPPRLLIALPASPRRTEVQGPRVDVARAEAPESDEFAPPANAPDPRPRVSGASVAADTPSPPKTRRPALLQPQRRVQWPMAGIEQPSFATPPMPSVTRRRATEASVAEEARTTESVVHVSIGRVELTALVPPAATRAKTPPRQPATSLADYLRSDGSRSRK
ncbi:MAG: hypothetical protein V4750_17065 [Pseudomonadota bacterium]